MKFKAPTTVSLEQRLRKLEKQQRELIDLVANINQSVYVLRDLRIDDIRALDDTVSALDHAIALVEDRVSAIDGEDVVDETTVNSTRDNDWYLGFARLFSNRKTKQYEEGFRKW